MDSEQVKKTDGWKKISCVLFAVLLIFNGALAVMQLLTNAKLEKHNKILITVPPELRNNIEQKFCKTADAAKAEILAATTATLNQTKKDAEDKANETARQIEDHSTQRLSDIGNQNKIALDSMAKKLAELEAKIVSNSVYAKSADDRLSKIDKQIKVLSATTDKTDKVLAELKSADEKLAQRIVDADRKNTDAIKQMISSVEKQLAKRGGNTDTTLAEMSKQIKVLSATTDKTDKVLAELKSEKAQKAKVAINMAKKAAESGDLQLAKIYALNAISHRQNNIDFLKFYAGLVEKDSKATTGELNQVLAILDGSLYNVPAEDVSKVLTLREQVGQRKNQLDAQSAVPAINLNEELKSVSSGKYALKNIVNGDDIDADKLQKRIEKINALLGEELTDESRAQLTKDLQSSSNIYSAHLTFKSVISALDKAESHAGKASLTDEQILSARNQLSTATTLLAQIWTLELPQNIVKKAEAIQKRISDVDEKLNVLASLDAMKKYDIIVEKLKNIKTDITNKTAANYANEMAKKRANNIVEKLINFKSDITNKTTADANKEYKEGTLTRYLMEIQECAAELQSLKIFDKKGQQKAIETLKDAQKLAVEVSAQRYKAYQLWAVNKIETVLKHLNDKKFYQAYTNAQAIEDFRNYLMDIDRGLLTYDVGTCYDKAFYLIFTDQVPDSKKAELQFEKATFKKMGKLEDF